MAMGDEEGGMAVQSGGANTKGAINKGGKADGNFKVAPEDSVAPADREELSDDVSMVSVKHSGGKRWMDANVMV